MRLKIRLEGQIKKLRQQAKVLRKEKRVRVYWDEKTKKQKIKTADKSDNTTGRDK